MKPFELMVRSAKWDRETKAAFHAHLKKNLRDDSRLDACRRKADFMNREQSRRTKRAALALVSWALETFRKAGKQVRSLALSTRAELLEALGEDAASASAQREAGETDEATAASTALEARSLLRASGLVATPEVLRLERAVLRDPTARSLAAYALWRHAIAAFCAVSRGESRRARLNARKALEIASAGELSFDRWIKAHRRASVPGVDLRPRELAALLRLAQLRAP